ncbi:unnamed protein product [Linum tenue]|uniref:Transmembrane protein n=1 Tax=Linum tenue TaxID=586396 RepID=A0AAV0H4C6_9ROSI|nr:unnamed protein product [Linum tenue]
MNSTSQFQSPFLSLASPYSLPKHTNQPWNSPTLLSPSRPRKDNDGWNVRTTTTTTPTRAMSSSSLDYLVLGVATAKRGDIAVLLPTGGLLLFFYVISNFVFPHFLMKYYESEAAKDEDNATIKTSSDDD